MTLMYLIVIGSVLFVYFDATKNEIGKVPGEKGFTNMSAGVWAIGTWLLWIVAFPLYLINRKKLIEKAQNSPQEVPETRRKIILGLVSVVFIAVLFNGVLSGGGNVGLVKNGMLEFDKSLTVGEAFDNYKYFKKVNWESFTTENGREVVQVTGDLDLDLHPQGAVWKEGGVSKADVLFQFLINRDGDTFNIQTFGLKMKMKDGTEKTVGADEMGLTEYQLLQNLKEIYDNKPIS
jgi:hypothetical protein